MPKKSSPLFIGEFPPPYGGVTVKNKLLLDEVLVELNPEVFNLYDFKQSHFSFFLSFLSFLHHISCCKCVYVGVGSNSRLMWVLRIVSLLKGRVFLSKVVVFLMGRTLPDYLANHRNELKLLRQTGMIFTESETLNAQLVDFGVDNLCYLPNFRKDNNEFFPQPIGDTVHFVYFARICPEKGADTVLDAIDILNHEGLASEYDVTFYGQITETFENPFLAGIQKTQNAHYAGVFDSVNSNVYRELNRFDSSASSSSWPEGMSGTNIECKFAGIANIVGDGGLNAECVENGVDGFVVKAGDAIDLAKAMRHLIVDHNLLMRMKVASYESRTKYSLSKWKKSVLLACKTNTEK